MKKSYKIYRVVFHNGNVVFTRNSSPRLACLSVSHTDGSDIQAMEVISVDTGELLPAKQVSRTLKDMGVHKGIARFNPLVGSVLLSAVMAQVGHVTAMRNNRVVVHLGEAY